MQSVIARAQPLFQQTSCYIFSPTATFRSVQRSLQKSLLLAKQIKAKLDTAIQAATVDSSIRPELLAGLISVEDDTLNPYASRFEAEVFDKLQKVRDAGWFRAKVLRHNYNGITQRQLRGLTDNPVLVVVPNDVLNRRRWPRFPGAGGSLG